MISAQTNSQTTTIPWITPNGEHLLSWKQAHLLIPDRQIIPVKEGTHLQVIIPLSNIKELPIFSLEPKYILQAYLLSIATAKVLAKDPILQNVHVNIDMRTIRPSFDGVQKGRYTCLVIEIYGRRLRGSHFGEPAPTSHNHWMGNRIISESERWYIKNVLTPRIKEQIATYEHLSLFKEVGNGTVNPLADSFPLWRSGRYELVSQKRPLLDAQKHGFHFVLRNIPEDLKSAWYDPVKTIEMIGIGIGIGQFLRSNGYTVSDAFYDINMNWGIFWQYFRGRKLVQKRVKKKVKRVFLEKLSAMQQKKEKISLTHIYIDSLLSLRPNSLHLHTQFAKTSWEIPHTPDSFAHHKPLSKAENIQIREMLSGGEIGTQHDPLFTWVEKHCSGSL
jgi:hypothetical protein